MSRRFAYAISAAAVLAVLSGGGAQSAGNLASKPTELTLAADTGKLTFSQTKFDLETGKYYKLHVSSDGKDDIRLKAPELWQNSWIDYIQINDVELFNTATSFQIGFDEAGQAN